MRFDDRFLDEIRSRLRPSDVIGKTVKLRRQGREYAGLSPFTKEKTPSFFVNDEKGFYHCFSSGKHGDIFSFLQETERLSFPEAVERLAGEAGVPMPVQDARSVEHDKQRATLQDWLEAAAAWFEGELKRPGGQAARAYLAKRALPEDDWKRFRIGYAPSGRTALKDYLVQKGARPADLVQAGLVREVAVEGRAARFDATGVPHHHFICDRCGSVREESSPAASASLAAVATDAGFTPRAQVIELAGLCARCQAASAA